jgi:hypothetical protein
LKSVEILWFEDINPLHEAIFGFPVIGKLSMRQMMILGIGALVSWLFYQASGNFISLIPMGITMFLILKKQKIMSTEMHLFLILLFYFYGKKKSNVKKIKQAAKPHSFNVKPVSSHLGLAEPFNPKMNVVRKEINVREIYADPLKPVRLKVKLERIEGKLISNKQTRIVYDGKVVSILSTDNNGELEVIIVPQTLGKKTIQIFVEGMELPIFEEILFIKHDLIS